MINMNASQIFNIIINDQEFIVNSNLKNWQIHPQRSSYVDYIAINTSIIELFLQFKNGTCFIFKDVPIETMNDAIEANSIGRFYKKSIKGKFENELVGMWWIIEALEYEEYGNDWDSDYFE